MFKVHLRLYDVSIKPIYFCELHYSYALIGECPIETLNWRPAEKTILSQFGRLCPFKFVTKDLQNSITDAMIKRMYILWRNDG